MLGKFIDKPREDSLTAAVFSHLLHLPSEVFWQILRHACYTQSLPDNPGEPLMLNPWPNWNSAETENSNRVIPDLFMRFASFDLIVESKIKDDGTQCRSQWLRELIAYTNEYGKEKRSVVMIALGGLHTHQDDALTHHWPSSSTGDAHTFNCPVHMCKWSSLLLECQRMERELGELEYQSSQTRAHQRILTDLIDLFAWHGFVTLRWFNYSDFKPNLLGPSTDSDQQCFRNISLQLKSA